MAPLAVMVLLALGGAVVCVLIDWGHLQLVKADLQTAADVAARAGVKSLPNLFGARTAAVRAARERVADGLPVDLYEGDVEAGTFTPDVGFTPDATPVNAIRVTLRRTSGTGNAVHFAIGSAVGVKDADIEAQAVATTQ